MSSAILFLAAQRLLGSRVFSRGRISLECGSLLPLSQRPALLAGRESAKPSDFAGENPPCASLFPAASGLADSEKRQQAAALQSGFATTHVRANRSCVTSYTLRVRPDGSRVTPHPRLGTSHTACVTFHASGVSTHPSCGIFYAPPVKGNGLLVRGNAPRGTADASRIGARKLTETTPFPHV